MGELSTLHTPWSDRLAFDVALRLEGSGETLEEVAENHRITVDDLKRFSKDKQFAKRVEHWQGEIREHGMTFQLKARVQAEALLNTSWVMIHSPEVSPAVRADLIKQTVKWAGLEANDKDGALQTGGVSITINLGDSKTEVDRTLVHVPNSPPPVIDAD